MFETWYFSASFLCSCRIRIRYKMDDYSNYRQNCIECVISKATNDMEEQEEILSSVVDLYL